MNIERSTIGSPVLSEVSAATTSSTKTSKSSSVTLNDTPRPEKQIKEVPLKRDPYPVAVAKGLANDASRTVQNFTLRATKQASKMSEEIIGFFEPPSPLKGTKEAARANKILKKALASDKTIKSKKQNS